MTANSFGGTAQKYVIFSPLDIYLWEHFKVYCIQLQLKIERHLTRAFFVSAIRNRPENFEKVWQYMISRVHLYFDLTGGDCEHLL